MNNSLLKGNNMTINIITCVIPYKNRLAIGKNNDLLIKLKEDQKFFKNITSNSLSSFSKLQKNVVLMGRKTWFSIPQEKRPLENRINLVLTRDNDLIKTAPYNNNKKVEKDVYFLNYKQFLQFYKKYNPNVFVIGGSNVYNMFLENNGILKANNIFLTEVKDYKLTEDPDTFINVPNYRYKLIGYSQKFKTEKCNYRILTYKLNYKLNDKVKSSDEFNYLNLAKKILKNGKERIDRTGVGTISTFVESLRFDISDGTLPLLTTKRVPIKGFIEELLFFCRGDTDTKILDERGVKIWNANSSREFLDKRGLHHYKEGVAGAIYGWQWRFFGANYSQAFADTSLVDTSKIGGFDQLENVVHQLKTDPFSRRIIISAWNPVDLDKMCLPPCHFSIQFYVEEKNGDKYLSAHFNMRSTDVFLGLPFNIASYALLVHILAKKVGMKTKEIIYTGGDVHLYKNHIDQINEQIDRTPRPFPKIYLNDCIKNMDWSSISYSDFEIIGYFPYSAIKANMAV